MAAQESVAQALRKAGLADNIVYKLEGGFLDNWCILRQVRKEGGAALREMCEDFSLKGNEWIELEGSFKKIFLGLDRAATIDAKARLYVLQGHSAPKWTKEAPDRETESKTETKETDARDSDVDMKGKKTVDEPHKRGAPRPEGTPVKKQRTAKGAGAEDEEDQQKLDNLWADKLIEMARTAPDDAEHLQTALRTKRPNKTILGLFGRRRSRTIRALVQDLQKVTDWRGSMKAFWTMDETGVIDFIHAQAARPCGKGVPEKFIRQIRIVWNKLGLPPIVSTASSSVAASLKKELSASNPRVVKKAITLPLLLVVAMELAIADGDLMGEDRAVIGAELVKVYTSARFDDILHLD